MCEWLNALAALNADVAAAATTGCVSVAAAAGGVEGAASAAGGGVDADINGSIREGKMYECLVDGRLVRLLCATQQRCVLCGLWAGRRRHWSNVQGLLRLLCQQAVLLQFLQGVCLLPAALAAAEMV